TFGVLIKDITPPTVRIISPEEVRATHSFTLLANATDNDPAFPEGAIFQWEISELGLNHTGEVWTLTLPHAGLYTVRLRVVDRFKNSAEAQVLLRCLGDGTPPRVVSTTPAEGEKNVTPRTSITVEFSEPISLHSLSGAIELTSESGRINFTYVLEGSLLHIYPAYPLPQGERITLTLLSSLKDESGEPLAGEFRLTFQVAPPLRVIETQPQDGERNVSLTPEIRVVFSTAINNTTAYWVKIISPIGREVKVERRWYANNNTLILIPTEPLLENTVYTVVVGEYVEDIYGGMLGENIEVSFVTRGVSTAEREGGEGGEGKEAGMKIIYLLLLALLAILLLLILYVRSKRKGEIVLEEAGKSPFGRKAKVELSEEEKVMALKKFEGQPARPLEGDIARRSEEEREIEPPPEETEEEIGWEERPYREPLFEVEKKEGKAKREEDLWPEEVVVWEEEEKEEEVLWDLDDDVVKWEGD
ncbi:MAG: Ig-like domain-containing protein, partial [Thermoplasmata archaeon]|nr:Ig-like domain-containing protein [Thermoplasmata archaeon]